jgi:hypothetical protein
MLGAEGRLHCRALRRDPGEMGLTVSGDGIEYFGVALFNFERQ